MAIVNGDFVDLVGITEIAKRCNVNRSAVSNWTVRDEYFPSPVVTLAMGSVWDWKRVEMWLVATGRKSLQEVL